MLTTREMNTFVTGRKAGTSGRTAVALACVATMLLTACGGGGAGDTPVATAVGAGTTTGTSQTAAVTTGSTTTSTSSAGSTSSSTTTTSSVVVAAPAVVAAAAPTTTAVTRSIREWVTCGGTVDGAAGVARAVQAAKNGAFVLNVDCPVLMKIGMDIAKPVFIDSDTTIKFSGAGVVIVDNVFVPAFVIANAARVNLIDWRIQYSGSMPIDWVTGGFYNGGEFVSRSGGGIPSNMFNDITLRSWLTNNKQVNFDGTNPYWTGPIAASAVFHIRGATTNLLVSGMKMYVPSTAGGHQFIPVAFSFSQGPLNGKVITATSSVGADNFAVPSNLKFDDIDLDGTYMGWQGSVQDVVFNKIRSHRYGDLQDAAGGNVGGIGKWFAPPHLFYLNNNSTGEALLANKNITITDVIDYGNRVGVARDRGNGDSISGYANSLKVGGNNVKVDGYESYRPDGVMDVLPSDGFVVANLKGSYNSTFVNSLYPAVRFPSLGYKNVTFRNVSVADAATMSALLPLGAVLGTSNANIVFDNVKVRMNKWSSMSNQAMDGLAQIFEGTGNNVVIQHDFTPPNSSLPVTVMSGLVKTLGWTLTTAPSSLRAGASTTVEWKTVNAARCATSGGFAAPATGLTGSKLVSSSVAGTVSYGLTCSGIDGSSASPTISVTYTP
jgi:hypothetical protein